MIAAGSGRHGGCIFFVTRSNGVVGVGNLFAYHYLLKFRI